LLFLKNISNKLDVDRRGTNYVHDDCSTSQD
jgi:hypothetical protein